MLFGNTAERLKPLNIRNTCGERLEQRSLHPPPVPARDLPLDVRAYNRYLAWSWAFQGCTQGSHIQKIRQTNTAETPLVILIKKHHETKKKEKKGKNCARLYPAFASLTYLPFSKSGDVVGINTKYNTFGQKARLRIIKYPLPPQHIDTSIEYFSGFNL